ncbi:autotransporter outer membrane beta-barrel domain-containing protein [Pseudomonas sp. F1_0610]|uniref:autotransporter domain-containing protein n=1 Tax=Pseudomonas sp. F1_0610 TaxID=3114284 RepID=UPI0039C37523
MRLNTRKTTQTNTLFKKTALASAVLLTLFSTASFAQDVYDGSQPLTDSSTVAGNLEHLVGAGDGVLIDGNGADLLIDNSTANTPKFVVGGYAGLLGSGQDSATVNGNKITIEKGNIDGNVYGGLAHHTEVIPTKIYEEPLPDNTGNIPAATYFKNQILGKTTQSNSNEVNLISNSTVKVDGNIYAGSNNFQIIIGDVSAENVIKSGVDSSIKSVASFNFNSKNSNNSFESNNNKISIAGNSGHKINNITSGSTTLQYEVGSITSGETTSKITGIGDPAAYSNIIIIAEFSNNKLFSNENAIFIKGNGHTFNNISSGNATFIAKIGDITAKTATSLSPDDLAAEKGDSKVTSVFNAKGNYLTVNDNKIKIEGDGHTFNNISAGSAVFNVSIGDTQAGQVIHTNEVINSNSLLTFNVIDSITEVNGNEIDLQGSSNVKGSLYGGYVDFNISSGTSKKADSTKGAETIKVTGHQVKAIDNTITINGSHKINSTQSDIYGGYLGYNEKSGIKPDVYDVFTGNTLNYNNKQSITIGTLANFQNYNFTINPEMGDKNVALINAERIVLGSNIDNVKNADGTTKDIASDIKVVGINSGKLVATDTQFILMNAKSLEGKGEGYLSSGLAQQGISLLYDVETSIDGNKVIATIKNGHGTRGPGPEEGPKVNPQLKSLLEGNLSGLMLVTRGADNIAYNTFAAITEQNQHKGLVPFIQASGHYDRYNSGSHIDANGSLLTTGLSFQDEQLTLAGFLELGTSNYDTYNSFHNANKVHGKGDNRYYGAGLYGQFDFANGVYIDGSLRGGRLNTKYSTSDIRNAATGESAEYKLRGKYLSAHAGVGYVFDINNDNQMDVSLKYLWTETDSHDKTVAGDPIHFDKLKSSRLRANAENSYKLNHDWSLLTGFGVEHEFEGKATGTTYAVYGIDSPSVKGTTAIGTLGVRFNPEENKRLTIDLKGNAYTGKRDGGSASLHVKYAF